MLVEPDLIVMKHLVEFICELLKVDICEDIVYSVVLKQILLDSCNKSIFIATFILIYNAFLLYNSEQILLCHYMVLETHVNVSYTSINIKLYIPTSFSP